MQDDHMRFYDHKRRVQECGTIEFIYGETNKSARRLIPCVHVHIHTYIHVLSEKDSKKKSF